MLFKKNNTTKIASKSKKRWLIATMAATAGVADNETLIGFENNADFYLVPKNERGKKKVWEATYNGITVRVTEVSFWWQDWTAERVEKETLT